MVCCMLLCRPTYLLATEAFLEIQQCPLQAPLEIRMTHSFTTMPTNLGAKLADWPSFVIWEISTLQAK